MVRVRGVSLSSVGIRGHSPAACACHERRWAQEANRNGWSPAVGAHLCETHPRCPHRTQEHRPQEVQRQGNGVDCQRRRRAANPARRHPARRKVLHPRRASPMPTPPATRPGRVGGGWCFGDWCSYDQKSVRRNSYSTKVGARPGKFCGVLVSAPTSERPEDVYCQDLENMVRRRTVLEHVHETKLETWSEGRRDSHPRKKAILVEARFQSPVGLVQLVEGLIWGHQHDWRFREGIGETQHRASPMARFVSPAEPLFEAGSKQRRPRNSAWAPRFVCHGGCPQRLYGQGRRLSE